MSHARRERLAKVIQPLLGLSQFSVAEAKQHCSESTPAYVTKTIGQLVQEGFLECLVEAKLQIYRWKNGREAFTPKAWIDRQIHGGQVTQRPLEERPREKLLREGPGRMSDADLLAILIRVGIKGESATDSGRIVANRFASRLPDLRNQSVSELKAVSRAINVVSYSQIMAGIELGRRVAQAETDLKRATLKITSTREAVQFCEDEFVHLARDGVQEEFHIVTLDTKHKPLRTHCITVGTLDASLVHPREVFRPAIRDSASAVLLVHNHPSGDPTPSREDHAVTKRLTEVGDIIGINVLDHIIVAREGALSLREHS